jgi:O-antigen ligase
LKFVLTLKRALAPFLFVIALLCLFQASRDLAFFVWWLGLCLFAVFCRLQREQPFSLSWTGATLTVFCLLLLANALYLNPVYHAEGVYFAVTLLFAFLSASYHSDWLIQKGFRIFCSLIALIAVWALVQWLTGWGFLEEKSLRSVALFSSPNTLSTTLNLCLMPVLAYYLLGYGERGVYSLTLLLFAGLLSTQSRGGYLGLIAGVLFLLSFTGRAAVVAQWQRYRAVALGFSLVLAFFKLCDWLGLASWSMDAVFATFSHGDSSYRWELYQLAWRGLAEHLWLGIGYFNFGYYFQAHKIPPFLDGRTFFVHSDYLQFALETGLLGLGLFLLFIVVLYRQLFKFRRQAISGMRLPLILSASAITTMLAHALVDYPFYIPVLLAVFGAYAGVVSRQLIEMGAAYWQPPKVSVPGLRPGFIGKTLAVGLTAWLGLPAFASVSADYGLHRLLHGDAQSGLYWHGVARVLQPFEAAYYWHEGVILRDLGVNQKRPELMEKSNSVFSKGLDVNPLEVNNLLEKIALHRQHGAMLKQPASHQELMVWINRARELQPHSDSVLVEYVRCLDFTGKRAEAAEQAKILVYKRPQSKTVQKLFESVSHE